MANTKNVIFVMALRYRPMQSKDVRECAEIVATHPVIGPRYGSAIKELRSAWLRLLGCEAMTTAVFEEIEEGHSTILGIGVGVFVRDDFIRELKTTPMFWFGPELVRRVMAGNSPVLSDREVREANSSGGLNELVWETLTWPRFANRTEIYHLMGSAYIEVHRGYLFKEMITTQAESAERLQWAVDAGGFYWNPATQCYTRSLQRGADEFIHEPHIVGIPRELEFARPGSWVGVLFDYRPPCLGFTPREQSLLLTALGGERTDRELADMLCASLPTIKKRWLSIYRRVDSRRSGIIPDRGSVEPGSPERGKEKRRRLLAYLREHPEELRPVSRKRLQQSPARIHS